MHGHRGAMGRTRGEVGKRRDGDMGRRSGEEVCAIGREGKGESGGENEQLLKAMDGDAIAAPWLTGARLTI